MISKLNGNESAGSSDGSSGNSSQKSGHGSPKAGQEVERKTSTDQPREPEATFRLKLGGFSGRSSR